MLFFFAHFLIAAQLSWAEAPYFDKAILKQYANARAEALALHARIVKQEEFACPLLNALKTDFEALSKSLREADPIRSTRPLEVESNAIIFQADLRKSVTAAKTIVGALQANGGGATKIFLWEAIPFRSCISISNKIAKQLEPLVVNGNKLINTIVPMGQSPAPAAQVEPAANATMR